MGKFVTSVPWVLPALFGIGYGASFLFSPLRFFVPLLPALLFLFLTKTATSTKRACVGTWGAVFAAALVIFFHLRPDLEAQHYIVENLVGPERAMLFYGGALILWLLVSAWVALPYGLAGYVYFKTKRGDVLDAVSFAALFTLAEITRTKLFFGIGWVDIGYWTFGAYPWLGVIGRIAGVYGLSFLTALLGAILVWWYAEGRRVRREIAIALILIGGAALLGAASASRERARWENASLPALAFQGYVPWKDGAREEFTAGLWIPSNYAELLRHARPEPGAIAVFPEEVLGAIDPEMFFYQWTQEQRGIETIRQRLAADVLLIGQAIVQEGGQMLNATFLFEEGKEPQLYAKQRLFPFVEYAPFGESVYRSLFPSGKEYSSGHSASSALRTAQGTVGIFSCFELLLPEYVREAVSAGAGILLSGGSEIAWEKPVWEQDILVSRFQAVSYKRFLVRAMKEGYSAIVNPLGELLAISDGRSDALLQARVMFVAERTLYSRIGNAGVAFLLLGIFGFTSFVPRKKRPGGAWI